MATVLERLEKKLDNQDEELARLRSENRKLRQTQRSLGKFKLRAFFTKNLFDFLVQCLNNKLKEDVYLATDIWGFDLRVNAGQKSNGKWYLTGGVQVEVPRFANLLD